MIGWLVLIGYLAGVALMARTVARRVFIANSPTLDRADGVMLAGLSLAVGVLVGAVWPIALPVMRFSLVGRFIPEYQRAVDADRLDELQSRIGEQAREIERLHRQMNIRQAP